jgi:hypothetical protein
MPDDDNRMEGLFDDPPAGAETTADATATPMVADTTEEEILHDEVIDPIENEEIDESVQDEVTELDYEAMYNTRDAEFKALEKRHTDFQSFNDSRINELDKRLNAMSQAPAEPKPEAMTKEQLQDMMYDDPQKAFTYMQQQAGPAQQGFSAEQMQVEIAQGVQRSLHDDYDQVINSLKAVAAFHPEIVEKIQTSNNKALTAYQEGVKLQKVAAMTADPEAFEKQLREKILNEQEEGNETSTPNLRNVPSSAPNRAKKPTKQRLKGLFDSPFKKNGAMSN